MFDELGGFGGYNYIRRGGRGHVESCRRRVRRPLCEGVSEAARQSNAVNFEWDPRKATQNQRKHGVSFHEAATVYADPLAVTYHDPDHSVSEQRYITVRISNAGRLLIVAHADRGETIKIISARKTTLRERKHFEQEN